MPSTTLVAWLNAHANGSVHNSPNLAPRFGEESKCPLQANGIWPPKGCWRNDGRPQSWFAWCANRSSRCRKTLRSLPSTHAGSDRQKKSASGYDSTTLAEDMGDLISTLGFDVFAMMGRDIGTSPGYLQGREDIYNGYQFETKASSAEAVVPHFAREFYIEQLRRGLDAA